MSESFALRLPLLSALLLAACTAPNPDYADVTSDALGDAWRDRDGATDRGSLDGVPGGDRPSDRASDEDSPPVEAMDTASSEDVQLGRDAGEPPAPLDLGPSMDVEPSPEEAPPDTSPPPDLPTSGLIGLWTFDESSGSQVADLSGKGNHGTIIGPVDLGTAWQPGKLGRALTIPNLIGPAVSVSPSVSIDAIKSAFSIAAWVKRTTDVGNRNAAFVSRQYGENDAELYTFAFVNNALVLWMHNPSGPSVSIKATRAAPLDTWIHATATWNGTTVWLFQDGTMVGSSAYSNLLPGTSKPLLLGNNANRSGLTQPLAGVLDEVRLYDRFLSVTEIQALATAGGP